MAERTGSQKRRSRGDAREKRRSLAAKPFEELDEAAGAQERGGASRATLKQAAATAVVGAVAAGVAGAAKALADRRGNEAGPEPDSDPEANEPEGEPQAELDDEQPQNRDEDDQQEQDENAEPQAGVEPEEHEREPEPEPEQGGEQEEQSQRAQPQGASPDEIKEIVEEAKRNLQELLGAEVEKVSGFDRSQGRWTVTLEVVNVRRVPDTTDVLSSYEAEFDDDRNLVSLSETRRYRRSQVEEG
jgi:Gas vesicle synthesis protein GvpO